MSPGRTWLGALATGAVLATFAGGALAQTAGSSPKAPSPAPVTTSAGFWADVAQHLHLPPTVLHQALDAAEADRLHALVSAGKLTAKQAQSLLARLQSSPRWPQLRWGHPRRPLTLLWRRAAAYLGLSVPALRQDLQQGKTLAQLAAAQGKTAQGLEQFLVQPLAQHLASRVQAGKMTPQQEQRILTRMEHRLQTLIDRTWHAPTTR